jgi:hypothetical protein
VRLPDWPARLDAYLRSRRDMPFAWGSNDCGMFAAGAVEAITGEKPGDWSYSGDKAALRLIAAGGGLPAILDGIYPRRPVERLQRGDIGLLQAGDWEYLSVIWNEFAYTPGPDAVVMRRTLDCVAGWAVD